MKTFVCLFVFSFCSILTAPSVCAQQIIDLGDLGGGYSYASQINDSGQIVGISSNSSGNSTAFLYSNGTMSSLGTLGGTTSFALAINSSGQVVGYSTTSSGNTNAFLYSGGTMTNLGTFGGTTSEAYSINNSGQVVGLSMTSAGNYNAFLYSGGTTTNLGTLGGTTAVAYGINNSGQITGYSTTSAGNSNAFLYSSGTMTSLGTLGNGTASSTGTAINNLGQVAGSSTLFNGGPPHLFIDSNGSMTDLGRITGDNFFPRFISDSDEITGWYYPSSTSAQHAFLYSSGTGLVDLNVLYASLLVSGTGSQTGFTSLGSANSVNNSGDIVGYGNYWNGTTNLTEAFLLTPLAVPEPSTWALLLTGMILLIRWRSQRSL